MEEGGKSRLGYIPSFVWGYILLLITVIVVYVLIIEAGILPLLGHIFFIVCILIVSVCLVKFFLTFFDQEIHRQTDRQTKKALLVRQELKNRELLTKVELLEQLPLLMKYGLDQGKNIKYAGLEITDWRDNVHSIAGESMSIAEPSSSIPDNVAYTDIIDSIPVGHVLLGCASDGIKTVKQAAAALTWIVGLSGTGKTTSSVIRIEERFQASYKFLGIDPHSYKPDSLSNAVRGYANSFLLPIARDSLEAHQVLDMFLEIFNLRKQGISPKPWQPISLVVDEINAINDPQDASEEELLDKFKHIARIAGQEARNFEMGLICISQQATGLAWLRRAALVIIVHQLLQEAEKKLALNGDPTVMQEMKGWPIGRTYVYGVGIPPITVQQPYFKPSIEGEWEYQQSIDSQTDGERQSIDSQTDKILEAYTSLVGENIYPSYRRVSDIVGLNKDTVGKILTQLKERGRLPVV